MYSNDDTITQLNIYLPRSFDYLYLRELDKPQ